MKETATGLVLEGGGLRGNFSAGVLRHIVDLKLAFTSIYGVSMGACNGANIVSGQPERNRITNTRFVDDSRYLSYLRLVKGGDLFGMDFIFGDIPRRVVPIDYKAFVENPIRFWVGVTDCYSGEAVMFEKSMLPTLEDTLTIMRASASLPLIAKPVEFNGKTYMDGGIANPIPLQQCLEHNERPVLVLTQPHGYRKRASKSVRVCKWQYPEFTGMLRVIERRHTLYNDMLATIEAKEKQGEIFVIRPESTLGVGRVCRDRKKLYQLYDDGYDLARKKEAALLEFLA